MGDLFSEIKEPLTPKGGQETSSTLRTHLKKGDNKSKSLFKIYYKGKDGKFSNEETARVAAIEKENKRLTVNCTYLKRQAERLSADYFTEHDKVKELETKVKALEEKLNSLTNNRIFSEKSYPQQERIFAS